MRALLVPFGLILKYQFNIYLFFIVTLYNFCDLIHVFLVALGLIFNVSVYLAQTDYSVTEIKTGQSLKQIHYYCRLPS